MSVKEGTRSLNAASALLLSILAGMEHLYHVASD